MSKRERIWFCVIIIIFSIVLISWKFTLTKPVDNILEENTNNEKIDFHDLNSLKEGSINLHIKDNILNVTSGTFPLIFDDYKIYWYIKNAKYIKFDNGNVVETDKYKVVLGNRKDFIDDKIHLLESEKGYNVYFAQRKIDNKFVVSIFCKTNESDLIELLNQDILLPNKEIKEFLYLDGQKINGKILNLSENSIKININGDEVYLSGYTFPLEESELKNSETIGDCKIYYGDFLDKKTGMKVFVLETPKGNIKAVANSSEIIKNILN